MSIEAIREALKAGPTEGVWHWDSDPIKGDPLGRVRYQVVTQGKTITQCYYSSQDESAKADAMLIAACNPTAIRALLQRLDEAEAERDRLNRLLDLAAGRDAHKALMLENKSDQIIKLMYELEAFGAKLDEAEKALQWRPIETAPKDGSFFLCWVMAMRYGETDEGQQYQEDVSQADFCHWQSHDDAPNGGWFEPCCGQIGDGQDVTHWMPLPPAPAIDSAAQKR